MHLVSVRTDQGTRVCGVRDGLYVDLVAADPGLPGSMRTLLALGAAGLDRVRTARDRGSQVYDPTRVEHLAPVPDPRKITCLGLNYRDHARETGAEPPTEPILFSKYATALVGHGGAIILPPQSREVDYEAELVVVIGVGGKNITEELAMDHVAGYAVGHDVSARDWQFRKPGRQWMAGKTFDTFAPVGPALVTADGIPDPHALGIRLRRNGETLQDSSTSELIFRVPFIVSYLSRLWTLEPGDLIFTGTPPGVGMARTPPVWLEPGDVVEVEIDGVGMLRNPVVGSGGLE